MAAVAQWLKRPKLRFPEEAKLSWRQFNSQSRLWS